MSKITPAYLTAHYKPKILLILMKLKRNIPLIYIIGSLMWGRFFIPVLALFYIASQVTIEQFTIIMAIFSLTTLLLDIPTGVIADLFGKKKTLLISRFLYIAEIFLIAFFNGFWIFLIAKIISGIGVSLSSGTSQSLLYDTLKVQKREKEHKKISGNLETITNISMAFVFIIGAYLFSINTKLPAIASLPLIILGFILTFFIKEPPIKRKEFTMDNSISHFKESLKCFKKDNFVKYLAFFSFFTAATINIVLNLSSPYFKEILIPIYLIGTIAFIGSMTTAFSSKNAHKLERKIGEKYSILLIQILVIMGIILMSLILPYWGVLFYLIICLASGFYNIVINDYINKRIESEYRATILSIKSMFSNLGIFLLLPLAGYFIKIKSMGFSFLIIGLIASLGYLLVYFYKKFKNL